MSVDVAPEGRNAAGATAVAAIASFTSLVAVPTETMPIFQVLLMGGCLMIAPQLTDHDARSTWTHTVMARQ